MSNKIVVLGSCNLDFISYAPRLPAAGETILGNKFVTIFGGKGANQCVSAAKLGGNTSMIGRVGDDVWGTKYLENLQNEKVDIKYVKITANETSGIAQIIVAETGENQIVITAGANKHVSVKDAEEAQDLINSAAVLVLQLETPIDTAIRAMELCKGISILNGAPALTEYDQRLLTLPTIFCVNETEASLFSGLPVNNISYAPRLPTAGETIHGHEFVTNFGGKGANQCVAAARLGGNTSLVARVGDDVWGTKYIDNLQENKVDTKYVKITENSSSGIAQINVADTGENQIVIVAGANQSLSVKDVEEAQELISSADVLVLQLETPVDTAIRAIQLCRGVSILNGAPALAKFDEQLLRLPTIFCVNESEVSVFTGLPVNNISEAEIAAQNLILKGCHSVLLTLGSQGALYLTDDDEKPIFKTGSPQVKCVDSTGAGDAFIGALAYFLASKKNNSREKAIEAACIVAADSVTRLGTQISFPGPEILRKIKDI